MNHHDLGDIRPVHRCRHCDLQLPQGKIFIGGNGHLYCNSLCSINAIAAEIAHRKTQPPPPFRQVSEASPNHPSKRVIDPVSRYVLDNATISTYGTPAWKPPPPKPMTVRDAATNAANIIGALIWLTVMSTLAVALGVPLFLL